MRRPEVLNLSHPGVITPPYPTPSLPAHHDRPPSALNTSHQTLPSFQPPSLKTQSSMPSPYKSRNGYSPKKPKFTGSYVTQLSGTSPPMKPYATGYTKLISPGSEGLYRHHSIHHPSLIPKRLSMFSCEEDFTCGLGALSGHKVSVYASTGRKNA